MGKVRVELVADFGPRRGQTFAGVVVEAEYNAILQAACNKLNLRKGCKRGDILLVLRDKYQGQRLLSRDADLGALLRDGATIVLTHDRPAVRVPPPPRWPWPSAAGKASRSEGAVDAETEAAPALSTAGDAVQAAISRTTITPAAAPPSLSFADTVEVQAAGCWAVLDGNVLPLVRQAISGVAGFQEKQMDGYVAFDYNASSANQLHEMFPDPLALPRKSDARLLATVRRECRGLLVCEHTGEVLARRLPKFFNVDEVEEASFERLPQTGGIATQKLDGSLVSPLLLSGKVRWATKSALVPELEALSQCQALDSMVEHLLQQRCTPIFEWCHAGFPVGVIVHSESSLVLLAVRENVSGEFWEQKRLRELCCDVVREVPFSNLGELLRETRLQDGVEGVVVRWPALGKMVKMKTAWWLSLAASQRKAAGQPARALLDALQSVPLRSVPAYTVWQAVFEGDDDQMSLVYGALAPEARAALRTFAGAVEQGIRTLERDLRDWGECAREATEADLVGLVTGWPVSLLAAYHRRASTVDRELRKFLSKMALSGQLLGLEALLGTFWDGGRQAVEFMGHLGTFQQAPTHVVTHVLDTYLPRKLGDYLGCAIEAASPVVVPRTYTASEGKIKGLWERFVGDGIIDLRVDLQPRCQIFDFHNGDADFAHWQVQFGPNDSCPRSTKARDGDARGAFAGLLLRTGVEVEFKDLQEALRLSFESQKVVRLDPSPSKVCHVYVDLDGVLADFDAGLVKALGSLPDGRGTWQHIEKTPGFFSSLPWMDGAKQLWKHLHQLQVPISILTGIPEGQLGERSAAEKREWVGRELGVDVEVITCLSKDKPNFSGQGRLLIDDRLHKGWDAMGGRQIMHRSVQATLLALADLGLGRAFTVAREGVLVTDRMHDALRAACNEAEVVAVDAEWPPDRTGAVLNSATVLQLAFKPSQTYVAFVIDTMLWDDELRQFVQKLLSSDIPKLVFGPSDEQRLGMRIFNATDMQEDGASLAAQARSAGIILASKSKQLQAGDWSVRPLRDEQIVYAAIDAAVLLELQRSGPSCNKRPQRAPDGTSSNGGRNASVEYVAVFLSPDSRRKLLRRTPPRFSEVVADHMTLVWKPACVQGLCIGAPVEIVVTGLGNNDKVQAVSVVTNETPQRSGHITVSHRQDAAAVEAGELEFDSLDEAFVLEGVVGVGIIVGGIDRATLPASILDRALALREGLPGQSERFEDMTDGQRHALHLLAEELGLEHRSEGKKGSRYRKMILSVPKRWKESATAKSLASSVERAVVKDAKRFAAIFGDVPGLQLHGRIERMGICWQPGVVLPELFRHLFADVPPATPASSRRSNGRLSIIMRGFPGSGKSSLATWLSKQMASGTEQVSADDFFTDSQHLNEAHEQCRARFQAALAKGMSVIVDNTNVRRSEYAFYAKAAEAAGYEVVVLELVCQSTTELERFRKRSLHDVPGGVVGGMWARWEQDQRALRLAPYEPQELMPWLKASGMYDHSPHTHLIMPTGPFLSVPSGFSSDFHARHAAEWGRNYISEIGNSRSFQLFFDIDGLAFDVLLEALPMLRALLGESTHLVLTGFEGTPPGYHIFAVGRRVDSDCALDLRRKWVEAVPGIDAFVDKQLYRNPQLRLLGSRKISKDGVDMGRVHSPLGRFSDDGWQPGASWEWHEVSIHG